MLSSFKAKKNDLRLFICAIVPDNDDVTGKLGCAILRFDNF